MDERSDRDPATLPRPNRYGRVASVNLRSDPTLVPGQARQAFADLNSLDFARVYRLREKNPPVERVVVKTVTRLIFLGKKAIIEPRSFDSSGQGPKFGKFRMKPSFKTLIRGMAASACALWLVGCEAEAEDAASATNAPVATTNAPATTNITSLTNLADTNAVAVVQTNLAGTNTINSQDVVISAVPPTAPPNVKLSKGVEEVVKLAQSGVSETVMLLFVEKSEHGFDLDAAEILYLNDIGVPQTVIAAMLNHDGTPLDVNQVLTTNTVATAPAPPTNIAATAPAQPAPQPVEVSSNYVADPNYQPPVVQQQPIVVQQEPVVVQQPVIVQPAVTHSYFYSSLAPYGSWVEVPDYGWCWRPTISVAHRGWRPYVHGGRWLHSNHGWYWHSDYSWGWAPFHYGRWYASPRLGWVWVPGYDWGASWVTWRYAGGHCGWAPLPPRCHVRPGIGFSYWDRHVGFNFSFGYSHDHYTFVPTRRFHERRLTDHVIPTEKTVNIYKDSTVVNNYIVGNNNTIVNQGISRDRIVSHTRTEIPQVSVQETPVTTTGKQVVPPGRLQRRGSELVVYRPQTPPGAATLAQENRGRGEVRRGTETPAAVTDESGTRSRFGQEARRGESTGIAATSTKTETVRPAVVSRSEPPPLAKPAPIRPEPAPVFTPRVQSSRAVQEARIRTETSGTTASPTVQPQTGSRFGRSEPAAPLQRQSTVSPTTPQVVVPSTSSRNEPSGRSRFGNAPAMPPSISGQAMPGANPPSISGKTVGPAMPPSISGKTAGPAMPPSISGQAVPGANATPNISSRPLTPSQNSRFGSAPPAAPPSIAGQTVPGATTRNESRSRFGNSDLSRQSVPQTTPAPVQVQPQIQNSPIQGNSRFGSTPPPRSQTPVVVPRNEAFNRPATLPPVQAAQPRTVTPSVPSRYETRQSAPPSGPSMPSGNSRFGGGAPPSVSSAPIGGNSRFGSAPPPAAAPPTVINRPSAPPSQPAQNQNQSSSGRGRMEIGR
jgi:hypothetical protein